MDILNVSQDAMYDVRIEFTLKNLCIISYFSVQNYGKLSKSKNIFKNRIYKCIGMISFIKYIPMQVNTHRSNICFGLHIYMGKRRT